MTTTKTRKKMYNADLKAAEARFKKRTGTCDRASLLLAAAGALESMAVVLRNMVDKKKQPAFLTDLATATAAMHYVNQARIDEKDGGFKDSVELCWDAAEVLAAMSNCPAPLELEPR